MKKLFAILLTAAMMATMSVSAFAATELDESPAKNQGEGDYTIGVNGTYVAGSNAEAKISVDIEWESMSFTYTAGDSTYSPENHTTTTAAGSWSTNKAGITVTNHSNIAIDATMSFTAGEDVTTTGTFYTKDDSDNYTAIASADDQSFTLESAKGKTRNDTDASLDQSPKGTLYFGVSGDAIDEDTMLGSITVKIEKEKVTTVTNETSLKSALAAGGKIKLGGNIELTETIQIQVASADLDITLDLNGYSIKNATSFSGEILLQMTNESTYAVKFVVRDSSDVGTGKIENGSEQTGSAAIRVYAAEEDVSTEIVVESGAISGYYALNLSGYAKATINSGTLTGNGTNTESTALYFNGNSVSAVIVGGTIETTSSGIAIRVTQSDNKLEIKGGEIIGRIGVTSGTTPTIIVTGGSFTFDPTQYLPNTTNYQAEKLGENDVWVVRTSGLGE